jgi:hypothetical protein
VKPRVYIETTVISYLAARQTRDLIVAARQEITWEWWQEHRSGFDLYISQNVLREAGAGDADAAGRRLEIADGIPRLESKPEVLALAHKLVKNGPIPPNAEEDALHISLATVHGMDYLLTWNCRHIANATIRNSVIKIADNEGYRCPVICTPEELLSR